MANQRCEIYLVDDDAEIRRSLAQSLELEGYQTTGFASAKEALCKLQENWAGVIISDINMPEMNGITFLRECIKSDPDLSIIMLTGHGDVSKAVESMRLGAYDFLEKPFKVEELLDRISKAFEKRSLILENRDLRAEIDAQSGPGPRIFGSSPQIKAIRRLLMRLSEAPANVLISGESGVGKKLAAEFLHMHGPFCDSPLISYKCGAVANSDIKQELEKSFLSSFKDAIQSSSCYKGKVQATLVLDEAERLSAEDQTVLVDLVDDGFAMLLDQIETSKLQVRLVSTTEEKLSNLVELGRFRQDLFYRLNVMSVEIPAIRERPEDVPLLFQNYLRIASSRYGIAVPRVTSAQLSWLRTYDWPGNLRELQSIAERFLLVGDDSVFSNRGSADNGEINLSLAEQVRRFERTVLQSALQECKGHLKRVQRQLNVPRKTLYEKMKKYGLEKKEYK